MTEPILIKKAQAHYNRPVDCPSHKHTVLGIRTYREIARVLFRATFPFSACYFFSTREEKNCLTVREIDNSSVEKEIYIQIVLTKEFNFGTVVRSFAVRPSLLHPLRDPRRQQHPSVHLQVDAGGEGGRGVGDEEGGGGGHVRGGPRAAERLRGGQSRGDVRIAGKALEKYK